MYLLAACMGAAVLIGVWQYMGREDGRKADKNSVRIGVLLYRGDDTFIGTLRTGLEDKAKEYEQETGIKVKLDIMDAKGSQNTQNSQVERLISLGCDALCINSCLLYTSGLCPLASLSRPQDEPGHEPGAG